MAKEITALDRLWDRLENKAYERKRAETRSADAKKKAEKKATAQIEAEDLEDASLLVAWEIVRKSRRHSIAAYAYEKKTWPTAWSKEEIAVAVEKLADAVEMESKRQRAKLANDPAEVQKILGKSKEKKGGKNA